MTVSSIEWKHRWLGGFCTLAAVGGMPVRGPDYAAHPPLANDLALPAVVPAAHAEAHDVAAAWSQALGGAPVVLVRSVERARTLLLQAAGIAPQTPIILPANATRPLVEAVKRYGAQPMFRDIGADLGTFPVTPSHASTIVWAQPVGGIGATTGATWVDYADTLPILAGDIHWPAATLFGLHLAQDAAQAGALLVFGDSALAAQVQAHMQPNDAPHSSRAYAQLQRLTGTVEAPGLATQQHSILAAVRHGLEEAAGLELLPLPEAALAHHIAVRIPQESDVATFYAYVRAEETPVQWLPERRPLHYAAVRVPGGSRVTADGLARILLVPVGPHYTQEEISHAVLGVAKAADYLGVRWRTNPDWAQEYGQMMDELYGADHDAYRPLFTPIRPEPAILATDATVEQWLEQLTK